MWIKIIRTKTWNELQADLDELRGAYKNLHELQKGLYQKYLTETNELSDTLKQREMEIEELNKKLRKSDHGLKVTMKKLKRYQNPNAKEV